MFCMICKQEVTETAVICPHCGAMPWKMPESFLNAEQHKIWLTEIYTPQFTRWQEVLKMKEQLRILTEENEEIKNRGISSDEENNKITPTLRGLIDDAFDRVTVNGPIVIENSFRTESYLEILPGMKIDRGVLSPYMVQNHEIEETILESPYILITNETLKDSEIIYNIINLVTPRSLLIIAEDVEDSALSTLAKAFNNYPCAVIRTPGFGDRRIEMLHDIALLTGGTAMIKDDGMNLRRLTLNMFGSASKVITNFEETIIVNTQCNEDVITKRIKELEKKREESTSDFDCEKLTERIESLSRGVAVIKVGGRTITEINDRMKAVIDYVESVKNDKKTNI